MKARDSPTTFNLINILCVCNPYNQQRIKLNWIRTPTVES